MYIMYMNCCVIILNVFLLFFFVFFIFNRKMGLVIGFPRIVLLQSVCMLLLQSSMIRRDVLLKSRVHLEHC
jgi:Na+-driven multidrug efflux pump